MAAHGAKRTSRWPTAPGRVSARQPTSFLCWCKERTQRKHLEYRTSMWESVLAGPCVQHAGLFAASRKALLDSATDAGAGTRPLAHSVTRVDGALRAGVAVSLQWPSAPKPRVTASAIGGICRARLCENRPTDATTGRASLGRPAPRWVFRGLLCPLSLHQQRKWVARRGEIPARGGAGREIPREGPLGAGGRHAHPIAITRPPDSRCATAYSASVVTSISRPRAAARPQLPVSVVYVATK